MTTQDRELCFLNLVSRGFTIAEARKKSGFFTTEPTEQPEAPVEENKESEEDTLRAKLKELGIRAHPQAKLETLRRKLDEADLL